MGICKAKLEYNNVQKCVNSLLFQETGQALLGIPDIDILNIININCNTIDTYRNGSANNYSITTAICQSSRHVQHYTNMVHNADRAKKGFANTDSISNIEISK